jgi:spermidine synthase
VLVVLALIVAVGFQSGVGTRRAQGLVRLGYKMPTKLLESYEGPEATVSAIEYADGGRVLVVDGFIAAGEYGSDMAKYGHYMAWMGHLPMILAADPKQALVICFGTGQTANGVIEENPQHLDIVDINPRVFKLAHNFSTNHGVLQNPKVTAIAMDGRAYMRRTTKTYDVITLEPMPPTFAGVNALYSREFYQAARAKLNPGGMIAQWVPFHILGIREAKAIARTFQSVFPNAILWIDPMSKTGILVGTTDDNGNLGTSFPGFRRPATGRDLSKPEVIAALKLNREQLQNYDTGGDIITDDNQLLAYGTAVESTTVMIPAIRQQENLDVINRTSPP